MTESRTFDGSAGQLPGDADPYPEMPAHPADYTEGMPVQTSSLDLLLRAVTEREAEEHDDPLLPVEIPDIGVRLMCRIDFDYSTWEKCQKIAIPRDKRRKPQPTDIRQNVLCTQVLLSTCEHVEIKDGETWVPVSNRFGDILPFDSAELRSSFGVMDAQSLIQKLFAKRDSHIIRAGIRVINAAGYGDEADEREALEADASPLS